MQLVILVCIAGFSILSPFHSTVHFTIGPLKLCYCPSDHISFLPLRIFHHHCLPLPTSSGQKQDQRLIPLFFNLVAASQKVNYGLTYSGYAQRLTPPPHSLLTPPIRYSIPCGPALRECDHRLALIPCSNPIKSPGLTCFSSFSKVTFPLLPTVWVEVDVVAENGTLEGPRSVGDASRSVRTPEPERTYIHSDSLRW